MEKDGIYSRKIREELVDDDEITLAESGFMEGYCS